jgi:prepilin-type N-terminal cleavage/methylation domain-containing protein/prepilin-type processing-associated H-X9-DG protein
MECAEMKKAFTLLELLIVITVIGLLMSILMPALTAARAQGRATVCRSNIRQLHLANIGYATENDEYMVLAASDIWIDNLHRWHGVRLSLDEPFDPLRGPLARYLTNGRVKECPEKVNFRKGVPWDWDFEDGCGGYGYNDVYIGSRVWQSGANDKATKITEVGNPAGTIMFADAAMSKLDGGAPYYLEYSFVKPRHWFSDGQFHLEWGDPSPSIHFRHRGKASVAWVDGHIDAKVMADFDGINSYGVKSADMMLGWFEPLDNSQFDLE